MTISRWRRKYGGLQVNDARRLKALEEENRQLKRIVADQALNLQVVKDQRKVVPPEHRRTAVTSAMTAAEVSERRACRYTGFARSTRRYQSRRPPDTELRARLHELAARRRRWGYRQLCRVLRREGQRINPKRVQRVYQEEGLQVRRR